MCVDTHSAGLWFCSKRARDGSTYCHSHEHILASACIYPSLIHPQVEALLHLARQNRAVARTAQNERSSRSHSVFQLQISGEHAARGLQCGAPLNLVDLAGSERLDPGLTLGPGERDRLRETQAINSSLSTLGLVIMALSNKVGMDEWAGKVMGAVIKSCREPCPTLTVSFDPPGVPCALPKQQAYLPAAELPGWQCQDVSRGYTEMTVAATDSRCRGDRDRTVCVLSLHRPLMLPWVLLFPQAHVCEHFSSGRERLRVSELTTLCLQGTIAILCLRE